MSRLLLAGEKQRKSYDQDFWSDLETEWKDMAASRGQQQQHPWLSEFDEDNESSFSSIADQAWNRSYEFREDNPLASHPDALNEGKIKLAAGDIPSAVLLFEAAVQRDPSSSEAWSLLGTTQAKNEQDVAAIAALKQALKLEPKDSMALMALAVSFTNESYQAQACHTLQGRWSLFNIPPEPERVTRG